jgi:hypothetical protein
MDEKPEPVEKRRKPGRASILTVLGIILAVITIAFRDPIEGALTWIENADKSLAAKLETVTIGFLADDFYERLNSCEYSYLFICTVKDRKEGKCITSVQIGNSNVCLQAETECSHLTRSFCPAPKFFDTHLLYYPWFAVMGVELIPKLPDAIWFVLVQRFHQGVWPFTLIVLFIAICGIGWGFAWRFLKDTPFPLMYRLASIIVLPCLVSVGFLAVQQLLLLVANAVGAAIQAILAVLAAVGGGHRAYELGEMAYKIKKELPEK